MADEQGAIPEGIARAKQRREARDASGVVYVDGSIYQGMEACLVRSGRTIAHVVKYADAVEIAEALATHKTADAGEMRPFADWHEDHGDVLWWKHPISQSPYVGSPLDLGRSMKVVVQIGFEEHDLPITMTGGWPFDEDDEASLYWSPLPNGQTIQAAIRNLPDAGEPL